MENSAFVDVHSSLVDAKKTKQFFPGSSAEGSRGIWRYILLMALADMMSLCVSWVSISGDFSCFAVSKSRSETRQLRFNFGSFLDMCMAST